MKGNKVASRYAKSFLELAIERGEEERAFEDMELVNKICEERDFVMLLKSPVVKTDKKISITEMVFDGRLSKTASEFIKIIIRKKREYLLAEIAEHFILQYKSFKNYITGTVTTAVPLDDNLKNKLGRLVGKISEGKAVELLEKIDPAILGGFIINVGDKQIDASVARRLMDLKQNFSSNPYVAVI